MSTIVVSGVPQDELPDGFEEASLLQYIKETLGLDSLVSVSIGITPERSYTGFATLTFAEPKDAKKFISIHDPF